LRVDADLKLLERAVADLWVTVYCLIQEQPYRTNVKRFRGGLVFKVNRLLYDSTLGSRVIKKKKERAY